jgi:hypothetical protein
MDGSSDYFSWDFSQLNCSLNFKPYISTLIHLILARKKYIKNLVHIFTLAVQRFIQVLTGVVLEDHLHRAELEKSRDLIRGLADLPST